MMQPSLSDVLVRVERAEREGRWWRMAAFLALAGLGALLLMGAVRPTSTLDTQLLVIRNPDREIVARLGSDAAGLPVLTMLDKDGAIRITLALQETGEGYMGVWGDAPKVSEPGAAPPVRSGAWLSVGPNGGTGRVVVYDREGKPAWVSPLQAGTPTLGPQAPSSTGRFAPSPQNPVSADPATP